MLSEAEPLEGLMQRLDRLRLDARAGRLIQAMAEARLLWSVAADRQDRDVQAEISHALAWFGFQLGHAEEGLEHATHAVTVWAAGGRIADEARARAVRAWLLLDLGRGEECAEEAVRSLEVAERSADPVSLAWALMTMAVAGWYSRQPERAMVHATNALALAEIEGDPVLIGWWKLNTAGICAELGQCALAANDPCRHADQVRAAIAITIDARDRLALLGESWGEGLCLRNLAEYHLSLGESGLALDCLHAAERVAFAGERGRVHQLGLMGQVLLAEGRPAAAIPVLEAAAAAAGGIVNVESLWHAWMHLSAAHEQLGAFETALHYYKRYHEAQARMGAESVQHRARAAEILSETRKLRAGIEAARAQAREVSLTCELLRRQAVELAAETLRDPLTGLGNRRCLEDAFEALTSLPCRFAVAMIDLDRFKEINDRFSHFAGDRVLIDIARLLQQECRDEDFLVRFGGEEFVLVLIGLGRAEAHGVCLRLCQAVRRLCRPDLPSDTRVTISIGLAFADEAASPDLVLATADRRLYAAKTAGRDRVIGPG